MFNLKCPERTRKFYDQVNDSSSGDLLLAGRDGSLLVHQVIILQALPSLARLIQCDSCSSHEKLVIMIPGTSLRDITSGVKLLYLLGDTNLLDSILELSNQNNIITDGWDLKIEEKEPSIFVDPGDILDNQESSENHTRQDSLENFTQQENSKDYTQQESSQDFTRQESSENYIQQENSKVFTQEDGPENFTREHIDIDQQSTSETLSIQSEELSALNKDVKGSKPPTVQKSKSRPKKKNEIKPGTQRKSNYRTKYSQETLKLALEAIESRGVSMRAAEREFNVPRGTLLDRLTNRRREKLGRPSVLTNEEENVLVERIQLMGDRGYQLNLFDVRNLVKSWTDSQRRTTRWKNNLPGKDWARGFVNRHKRLSLIIASKYKPCILNKHFDQ